MPPRCARAAGPPRQGSAEGVQVATRPPEGGAASATAARLIAVLAPHTPFAEAIVRRQAERVGRTLASLEPGDLPKVGPLILAAASVFLDPVALETLKLALRR